MKAGVAAGSETTANAAAEILDRGGNAVDAAVGACFAMGAGEPGLTGLAGGGVMLHRDGESGRCAILDFFADTPGVGLSQPRERHFYPLTLDFGPAKQVFHIGRGAAAVPGVIPGLCTALGRWGTMGLKDVIAPACRALREGAVLGALQDAVGPIVWPIFRMDERSRRFFSRDGEHVLEGGDLYRVPEQADTLEAVAETPDWRANYLRVVGEAIIAECGPSAGGLVTRASLEDYEVVEREALHGRYRSSMVFTNPPPASGGAMIALMLELLGSTELAEIEFGSRGHVHALARAFAVADRARGEGAPPWSREEIERSKGLFAALEGLELSAAPGVNGGPPCTSHMSVVDRWGNAASVTMSHGEGTGVVLGSTGIMMNNLMGEADLFPCGFDAWTPGERLTTMMSPTMVVEEDGTLLVLGTGGANRIRTAITQVVTALADYRMHPVEAVGAPRIHFEEGVLNAETFGRPGGDYFDSLGAPALIRFAEPNLFFGGVHMVLRRPDGEGEGAGDPRRFGVFLTV